MIFIIFNMLLDHFILYLMLILLQEKKMKRNLVFSIIVLAATGCRKDDLSGSGNWSGISGRIKDAVSQAPVSGLPLHPN